MTNRSARWLNSPLGQILIVSADEALLGLYFEGQKYFPDPESLPEIDSSVREPGSISDLVSEQLTEYFQGVRHEFQIPLALRGTSFQLRVWQSLQEIEYGTQTTYGEIARALGTPEGARAVGAAVGRNPISIIVPCHRVVGSDRSLTGYAGGLHRKQGLQQLEGNGLKTALT